MAQLRWTLQEWLEAHDVTRYELAQNMDGNFKTRLTSLYRTKEQTRIDLGVMSEIVSALRKITGETVTPNDLLEFTPDPEPDDADSDSSLLLNAALTPPLEPWEWGTEGEPEGQPVEFVRGEGLYVLDDAQ